MSLMLGNARKRYFFSLHIEVNLLLNGLKSNIKEKKKILVYAAKL